MNPRAFDFVVFDWKGTLEKKSGNKAQKEEDGLSAMLQVIQGT